MKINRIIAALAVAIGLVIPTAQVQVAEAGTRGVFCNVSYSSGAYGRWHDAPSNTTVTNERPGQCSTRYAGSDVDRWWIPAYRQVGYRCDNGPLQHTGIRSTGVWTGACVGLNQTVSVNIWQ